MIDQTALWKGYAGRGFTPSVRAGREPAGNGARWEDPEAFRDALERIDVHGASCSHGGVPLIGDAEGVYVDPGDSHTLIIGSTGSMKSRLMCMPGLEIMSRAGESVVVTDPKGELFDTVGAAFYQRGYDVGVINLRDPMKGMRWNPLHMPLELIRNGHLDDARALVLDLAMDLIPIEARNDPYWESSSQMLFYGMAWYLLIRAGEKDTVTISDVVENALDAVNGVGYYSFEDEPECVGVTVVTKLPENTKNCVMGVFTQKLWHFVSESSVVDLLSGCDIDIHTVGKRNTALFLIVPDEKCTYNALVSAFIKQLYSALIADAQGCEQGSLPVRVNFMLDEFANFPRIPNMQSMITASRSRNIRFTLVLQTEKQLRALYGDEADAIRDNCANWVFLTGRDIRFLNELCDLIGDDDQGKPLISISRLQRLEKKTALVLCGRMNPIISPLIDIGDYGLGYEKPVLESREPIKKDDLKKSRKDYAEDLRKFFND